MLINGLINGKKIVHLSILSPTSGSAALIQLKSIHKKGLQSLNFLKKISSGE